MTQILRANYIILYSMGFWGSLFSNQVVWCCLYSFKKTTLPQHNTQHRICMDWRECSMVKRNYLGQNCWYWWYNQQQIGNISLRLIFNYRPWPRGHSNRMWRTWGSGWGIENALKHQPVIYCKWFWSGIQQNSPKIREIIADFYEFHVPSEPMLVLSWYRPWRILW